jgi:hypothetical protein
MSYEPKSECAVARAGRKYVGATGARSTCPSSRTMRRVIPYDNN